MKCILLTIISNLLVSPKNIFFVTWTEREEGAYDEFLKC